MVRRVIWLLPLLSQHNPSHSQRPSALPHFLLQSGKGPRKHLPVTLAPLLYCCLLQIHNSGPANSTVQFTFYQPIIHRWRETDFFPCSATCGGGNGVVHLAQGLLASKREDLAIVRVGSLQHRRNSVLWGQILSSEWGQILKPSHKADALVSVYGIPLEELSSLLSLSPWKARTRNVRAWQQSGLEAILFI